MPSDAQKQDVRFSSRLAQGARAEDVVGISFAISIEFIATAMMM